MKRTIDINNDPRAKWDEVDRKNYLKAHWGQRKLLFSEIEFLVQCSKYYALSDCEVVYPGGGPGNHLPLLSHLFPSIHFTLVDPTTFVIKQNEKISIYNEYMTDALAKEIMKKQSRKHILFISDIRVNAEEQSVINDLISQQRWGLLMRSSAMLLKFRLPFPNHSNYNMRYVLSNEERKYLRNPDIKPMSNYKYMVLLEGKIHLQTREATYGSETRLIVFPNKDGLYKLKNYDIEKYDECLMYHNEYTRTQEHHYLNSNDIVGHLAGQDKSYDSTVEYFIITKYLSEYLKYKENVHRRVIQYLHLVEEELQKATKKNLPLTFVETIRDLRRRKQEPKKYRKIVNLERKELKRFVSFLREQRELIVKNSKDNPLMDPNAYRLHIHSIDKVIKEKIESY